MGVHLTKWQPGPASHLSKCQHDPKSHLMWVCLTKCQPDPTSHVIKCQPDMIQSHLWGVHLTGSDLTTHGGFKSNLPPQLHNNKKTNDLSKCTHYFPFQ